MLCDELIADGVPGSGTDIGYLLPALRSAQKFVLAHECAAVADSLSSDYSGLVKAFPHCRLPFAQTWIEFAHYDRKIFASTEIAIPEFQVTPKRIGYLLTAMRPDLSAWKAHLFWSTQHGCSCPILAVKFDMTEPFGDAKLPIFTAKDTGLVNHPGWDHASDSVKLAMVAHTCPTETDYPLPMPDGISLDNVNQYYDTLASLARADWAGEPAFLLAVIALLNARNAVETEKVDRSKLNRARVKRGKLPLFEHKVLKIARRQQQRYTADTRHGYWHARGHFVMGHWKVRKTGIYFWKPHTRGDFTRGRVEKTYEVAQ